MFGVLDIGNSKTVCIIGDVDAKGSPRVMGCGWARTRGIYSGNIIDAKGVEKVIRAAVGQVEEEVNHHLHRVTVSFTFDQLKSRLITVPCSLIRPSVDESDLRGIIAVGVAKAATEDRDLIQATYLGHVRKQGLPDGKHSVSRTGEIIALLHVIDASSMSLRNLTAVIARCDLGITELVAAPFASGLSVLVDDERELGCTVIDMSGGTTQMAVFADNQLLHTAQLPVGGLHVTKDIAQVLSTPLGSAERLKVVFGNAEPSSEDEREILQVQQVGVDEHSFIRMPRSRVVSVIRPRLEETFELLRDRLDNAGLGRAAAERVVLTGGASQLDGVQRLATRVLNRKVRLGAPTGLRGLPADANGPGFATASGLLAYAAAGGASSCSASFTEAPRDGVIRYLIDRLTG